MHEKLEESLFTLLKIIVSNNLSTVHSRLRNSLNGPPGIQKWTSFLKWTVGCQAQLIHRQMNNDYRNPVSDNFLCKQSSHSEMTCR